MQIQIPPNLRAIYVESHTPQDALSIEAIDPGHWALSPLSDVDLIYTVEFDFDDVLVYGGSIVDALPDVETLGWLLEEAHLQLGRIGDVIWHEMWNSDPESGEINFK